MHKGFKYLDIPTGRIYISRDVLFSSMNPYFLLPPYTLRPVPAIERMSYSHLPHILGIIILLIQLMFTLYPFVCC
jgi:hypothetical protein